MKNNDPYYLNGQSINGFLWQSLIRKSDKEFIGFMNFLSKFSHYSAFNSTLVYIQNKNVVYYGSKGFWKKNFKRSVKENAKPYIILRPFTPVILVYDVMDTDGEIPLDEFMKQALPFEIYSVKGDFNEDVYNRLLKNINKWNIKISSENMEYFQGGKVFVDDNTANIVTNEFDLKKKRFIIVLHELAHILLGHLGIKSLETKPVLDKNSKTEKIRYINLLDRGYLNRNKMELEAETVVFIVTKWLGLTTNSADYLAIYITDKNNIYDFNYEFVIHTIDKLINHFIKG